MEVNQNPYECKFNNKKVFEFYEKTNLNIEYINSIFIEILEKLIDTSLNTNLASTLLEKFNLLDNKIEKFGSSVLQSHNDITAIFNNNLREYKKEYTEELGRILYSNNTSNIKPLFEEINNEFFKKTERLITEIIPSENKGLTECISKQIEGFNSFIIDETKTLITSSFDKNSIDQFFTNINNTLSSSQHTLTTLISSSDTKTSNRLMETERKINEIKEISNTNNTSQQILQTNITEILKKFEKGVGKGAISEHILYNILLGLYPCASELEKVSDDKKETGDIMIKTRIDKPLILIENKDHESINVPTLDVEKFLKDCNKNNCCGILFSQHRGISNKEDFEININNKNVLLYVHKVKFDVDKIKLAIDIVEHYKTNLDLIYKKFDKKKNDDIENEEYIIDSVILENINNDYISFKNQKIFILKVIKDCGEKMTASLNELKLPNLEAYLNTIYSSSSNQNDKICKYCNKEVPKSLVQHYRYCKSKLEFDTDSETNETNELNSTNENIKISQPTEQINISIDDNLLNNVKQKITKKTQKK